jgi:hypothetical protein
MPPPFSFAQPAARRAWSRDLLRPLDEATWDGLARKLFAYQFAHVLAYRRLCLAHDFTPQNYTSWKNIPAVPQQLFKREKLYTRGLCSPEAIYETSGTTTGQPGRQHLFRSDIYAAVGVTGARQAGLFDGSPEFHFLVPSPQEAPHSSLSAMFGFWAKASRQKGNRFWARSGHLEFDTLREMLLAQVKARRPIAIAGTAFSFVHLLDAWADLPPLRLPKGSWLLETGGFKGRSREIPKAKLYSQMARTFSLYDNDIWNEYGMSELSSQAYARGTNGLHQTPPWARVLVVDPATNREVRIGQQGLVRWIDLANTDSVLALQTLDLAERTPRGFRLIGRLPRTEPRGCSLSADDLAASVVAAAVPSGGAQEVTFSGKIPPPGTAAATSTATTLRQRLDLLARAYPRLFPRADLLRLIRAQLDSIDVLERPTSYGPVRVRAQAPKLIYHVCAGNLAISAKTSLAHGLLLGARNVVKLPGDRDDSSVRREILAFIRGLPAPLRRLVGMHRTLDPVLFGQADVIVAFGSETTMATLRAQTRWDQTFIAHGPAVSLLYLAEPNKLTTRQARACAIDILTYDQLGCLSPQAIYVPPGTDFEALGRKLATALENHWRTIQCKPARPLSVAARIAEARDLAQALDHRVWLPPKKHLGWTIIHDPDPTFQPSPLHGVIYLRQTAESKLAAALAPIARRLSTIGLMSPMRPISKKQSRLEKVFLSLGVSRFCPAGRMQFPPLTWHHDGRAPLGDMVRWIDIEEGA